MNPKPPEFFKFTDADIGDPRVPIATHPEVLLGDKVCAACGQRQTPILGIRSCVIEGGEVWTDIIGLRAWPLFIVSERVCAGLGAIGASGFSAHPVKIQLRDDSSLHAQRHDGYFYLSVDGCIDIDLTAGGIAHIERCAGCFMQRAPGQALPTMYAPIRTSWSGDDLLRMHNYPNQQVFCTLRVVELAHEQGWSNARFDPMDLMRDRASRWHGIDYLASRWPPLNWYPPSRAAGKTVDEWVEQLQSTNLMERHGARIALSELDAEAIPSLTALLDSSSGTLRHEAARLLLDINGRISLPASVKEHIRSLLPAEALKKLR